MMSQSKGKNEKLKQLMIDFSRNQQMIARFQPYIGDFSVLGGEKKKGKFEEWYIPEATSVMRKWYQRCRRVAIKM